MVFRCVGLPADGFHTACKWHTLELIHYLGDRFRIPRNGPRALRAQP